MNLKHETDEELLKELGRRVDTQNITWNICYYYDVSKTKMEFRAEQDKFLLSFTVDTNIEKNYFVRKIYKQFEPKLLKIQQGRNQQAEIKQKETEKKIMETLRTELAKKKQ